MRLAVAALFFGGCASAQVPVVRVEPCICPTPCGSAPTALTTRSVYGVVLYPSMVERLEARWGTPLETTLPPPILSPADEVALGAWFDGLENPVLAALEPELDRRRSQQVESVEQARALWVDALAGNNLTPPFEAKLQLEVAIDDAVDSVISVIRQSAPPVFVAKLSAFTFPRSLELDAERMVEGTLVDPVWMQGVARARFGELAKRTVAAYAIERANNLADRAATDERQHWRWARAKP